MIHNTHDYRKRECGNIPTTGSSKSRSYGGLNMNDESSGFGHSPNTILVYQLLFGLPITILAYLLLSLFNPWRPLQLIF
jgi:hypothetical protein